MLPRQQFSPIGRKNGYRFVDAQGACELADLFGNKSQLIVYHFMFAPDWQNGCKRCSFWADNFELIDHHLAQRDISFVAASTVPAEWLEELKKRMGWTFRWLSSGESEFGEDFHVSSGEVQQQQKGSIYYNYRKQNWFTEELPGVSVFSKDDAGKIFHTYSTYCRGLDILNGAYNFVDLTPKGRHEEEKGMYRVDLRDQYREDSKQYKSQLAGKLGVVYDQEVVPDSWLIADCTLRWQVTFQ